MNCLKKTFLAATALLIPVAASAQSLTLQSVEGGQGTTIDLPVLMNNEGVEVTSFNCDIYFPEGVTVKKDDYGFLEATLSDRATPFHAITAEYTKKGSARFVSYSDKNLSYNGTSGVIFTTPIVLDVEPGEYTVSMTDIYITIKDGDNLSQTKAEDVTAKLTVSAPEVIRYTDNQLYAKDITIDAGEDAVLNVYYNSTSDVYEYETVITLPNGVAVEGVEFQSVVADVAKFANDWSVDGSTLTLKGEYGGGRRDEPAEGGNMLFAVVQLNTAGLSAGEYEITVGSQMLSNDDDDFEPEDYVAKLTVKGEASAVAEATMAIGAARWATFVAPFDVEVPAGVTASTVEAVVNGTLTLTAVKGTIPANTPVVLYSETEVNKTLSGKVVEAASAEAGLLVGTYTAMEAPVGAYVLQKHGEKVGFYLVGETRPTVGANRAYLNVPAGSEVKAYFFDDMETSIETVEVAAQGQAIYDLSGRRVQKAVKGMYIVDGKKVIK